MKKLLTILVAVLMITCISMPKVIMADEDSGTVEFIIKEADEEGVVEIDLFDPLELTVETVNGDNVKIVGYKWYLESSAIEPALIEKAEKDTLYIPSFNFITDEDASSGIECEISYTVGEDSTIKKSFANVNLEVDQTNYEGKKYIFIGGYTIKQGETFDLSRPKDTKGKVGPSLGKGTITLNENGDCVTLNKVNFNFDLNNLVADELFCLDKGFAYYSILNDLSDISFVLVGNNTFTNSYHIEKNDTDGATFLMSLTTDGTPEIIVAPRYHIVGNGSLNVNGGFYGILGHGIVDIDAKVEVNSTSDPNYPGRYGNGITGGNVIINKNAKVKLDIAGEGIRADIANDIELGKIDFMPGCKVDMTIRNYLRHPYNLQMNPTLTSGIDANNTINFDGADVNINMITDKKTCDEYARVFPDYVLKNLNPYAMTGISGQTRSFESEVNIKDSKIDIKEECINFPKDEESLSYARGINFSCNRDNNDNTSVNIINSKVNIDIPNVDNNISNSTGLEVVNANIIDSKLNINVNALNKSIGISELKLSYIFEHTIFYELFAKNSDVKINSNDIGILAEKIDFDYKDSKKKFTVNADNYGILSTFSKTGEEERKFEKHYIPEGISLKFKTIEENFKPINIFSSNTNLREHYSEDSYSLLDDNEGNEFEDNSFPFIIKAKEVLGYDKEKGFDYIRKNQPNYLEYLIEERKQNIYANVDSNKEETNDTYYYYETFYNNDKTTVANNVVIEGFKKEKEKEVVPQKETYYVVPNTSVK